MEVLYIDIFVRSRLTLAPQQKSLLSGQLYNNIIWSLKYFN